jgi:large subunit ribosomal protein L2
MVYRIHLNFSNKNLNGRLISIEYDPYRSSFIGLFLDNQTQKLFFDLICEGQKIGNSYKFSSSTEDLVVGNKLCLRDIPLGTLVSSVEIKPGKGSQYLRSAGSFGKLQKKDTDKNLAFIKMPSKKVVSISLDSIATIGIVSNLSHKNKNIAKAGRNR